jgi:hypothetical protein
MKKFLLAVVVVGLAGAGSFLAPRQQATQQPTPPPVRPAQTVSQPAPGPTSDDEAVTASKLPLDPCSAVRVTTTTTSATPAGAPGFPDEGFDIDPTVQAPDAAKPAVRADKTCENGRVEIQVAALPHFGHHIGDVADVRVLIATDPGVFIDFSSLMKARAIAYGGSDFALTLDKPASIRKVQAKANVVVYVIDLRLQTFTIKDPGASFNLDLRYATGLVPNTHIPDWRVLSTPPILITRSNTVDNGEELLEGNLQAQDPRGSWLMWPVLVAGFFLVLLWPGLILVNYLNRIRPGRKVPLNEQAWKKFNKTIKDAQEHGWDLRHYKQIAAALRLGLGYQPQTRLEILDRIANDPQMAAKSERVRNVLIKLDAVLYNGRAMTPEETEALIRELPLIIDRPE